MLLDDTPAVLSLGKLYEDQGKITMGPVVKSHISPKKAKELIATQRTMYPSLSLVYLRVLQAHRGFHGASSSSKKWKYEWGSTGKPVAWTSRNGKPNIKMTTKRKYEETCRMICQNGCRSWGASLSRAKVVSGKHSIFTHFSKDRNCDTCLRTQITRASCRKRTFTVVPKAEHVGDLITADHKVLSEGCESRNNHRYAVMVQDLARQWVQSYPCKTKNFSGDPEEPDEVPGADKETKSHFHWQFLGIWQVLRGIVQESLYVNTTQIRNKWDWWGSSSQGKRRDICGAIAVRSRRKMVGRFHGMRLQSAKHSRSLVWWENSIRKVVRNTN